MRPTTLLFSIVIVGLLAYVGATCFVAVDETQFVIIKQFGRDFLDGVAATICQADLDLKRISPIDGGRSGAGSVEFSRHNAVQPLQ